MMECLVRLAAPISALERLEIAKGYFDDIDYTSDVLATRGWMHLQGARLETIQAYLNGKLVAECPAVYRPDVAEVFPHIKDVAYSGFNFHLAYMAPADCNLGWLDLIGYQGNRAICQMNTLFHTNLDAMEPTPTPDLMYRVVRNRDTRAFKMSGVKSFGEFLRPILRFAEPDSLRTLLDWGCGCGRIAVHFLALGSLRVYGCDIDREAVEWCRTNLPAGEFTAIQPYPPTPYPDSSFDVIIGFSVLTHLGRKVQNAWLSEMRRLLSPGGIFLATVHGESVAGDEIPGQMSRLRRKGNLDDVKDPILDGIAPDRYYRGVYQTREYTIRKWSKYFDILDYVKRGVGNRQDLVVMRAKRALFRGSRFRSAKGPPFQA